MILISTAADRDWSDLPVKTAYLPLTQSLVSYLQGGKKGALETGVAVGELRQPWLLLHEPGVRRG